MSMPIRAEDRLTLDETNKIYDKRSDTVLSDADLTPITNNLHNTLSVYDRVYEGRFGRIETKLDENTAETTKLRETVNNGISSKVSMVQKLFFWFFGIYVTTTGAIVTGFLYLIKLINSL